MSDTSAPPGDAATNVVPFPAPAPANPWWRPPMRDVLAIMSTGLVAFAFVEPLINAKVGLDPDLKGAVLLQWGIVMGYYFGTSKTSVAKDKAVAAQLDKAVGQ